MAQQEPTTPLWFALRLGPTTFGVFDAFADEHGRQTHLNGPIAQALIAKAPELFTGPLPLSPSRFWVRSNRDSTAVITGEGSDDAAVAAVRSGIRATSPSRPS